MKERAEVASRSVRSVRDARGQAFLNISLEQRLASGPPPPPSPRRSRRETALNSEARISDDTNALATR